jgi:hypothetical protein
MDMVGPYCHPLNVQSSPDSSCLLTMLTTREGGTATSAPKRAKDDGEASGISVNDLGDGGAAMCALRRSQPWEAEAGGPADAGLVWWPEEDKTEETRQTVKAAGVLNNLN